MGSTKSNHVIVAGQEPHLPPIPPRRTDYYTTEYCCALQAHAMDTNLLDFNIDVCRIHSGAEACLDLQGNYFRINDGKKTIAFGAHHFKTDGVYISG